MRQVWTMESITGTPPSRWAPRVARWRDYENPVALVNVVLLVIEFVVGAMVVDPRERGFALTAMAVAIAACSLGTWGRSGWSRGAGLLLALVALAPLTLWGVPNINYLLAFGCLIAEGVVAQRQRQGRYR